MILIHFIFSCLRRFCFLCKKKTKDEGRGEGEARGKRVLIYVQGYCSNVTNKCVCSSGYGGLMCELDINECSGNDRICGVYSCINLPGDYKCDCDFFRAGKRCQSSSSFLFVDGGDTDANALSSSLVSGIGLFVLIVSSIVLLLIIAFLLLFAMRTLLAYRLSKRISKFGHRFATRRLVAHASCASFTF
jgi:hypothetical protein